MSLLSGHLLGFGVLKKKSEDACHRGLYNIGCQKHAVYIIDHHPTYLCTHSHAIMHTMYTVHTGTNGGVSLVEDMQTSNWEHTIRVNLTGTMMVTRELTPLLKEAGAPSSNTTKANCVGGGAAIVNISSNVSKRGLPLRADYVCSKWALLGLTQTLALELVNDGVRCNAVCPGSPA